MRFQTKAELIDGVIYSIRGLTVMFDCDLAAFFGVEIKALRQAVRRNRKRFPEDFMFIPTKSELEESGKISSSPSQGGARNGAMAFTGQGIAMLSSVLDGERAVDMSIEIMRTITRMFEILSSHEELIRKIEGIEKSMKKKS
ncbi:MAG TPA: ORF6N domain-containing protein [Spirochaetota bacterium]|nr:ORF6N domain-containing protein [Spirochaetota bacterium]HRZ28989.1 ORF6N domain-containing protein [Spirochaetota bacterium]